MTELVPLLVRLLAVAGGAAFGWMAISVLVGVIRRFLGVRSVPGAPLLVARVLGAVAAGWVVWLLVFGFGGSGIGGPGGPSVGGATGSGKASSQDQIRQTQRLGPDQVNSLTVVMLGGHRVKEDRYYQIWGETEARSFTDLKELVRKRQMSGLQAITIVIYADSVARNHTAVTSLHDWAREHDLKVSLSFPEGNAP
jgi:hypothetical protein